MSDSIRLSEKYGVNPAIPHCFFCGDAKNEVILAGKSRVGDEEAPRNMVWNQIPCDKCEAYMKLGIMLLSVRNGEEGQKNPYRTGCMAVVTENAIRELVEPALAEIICKKRMAFVPDETWDAVGLPRENKLEN